MRGVRVWPLISYSVQTGPTVEGMISASAEGFPSILTATGLDSEGSSWLLVNLPRSKGISPAKSFLPTGVSASGGEGWIAYRG